jgi:uncharacterized protein
MTDGTKRLRQAWEEREGPAVLATVDTEGRPNAIYVGEIRYDSAVGFVVADNFFDKTRRNIKSGCAGAILFLTKERKAYQVKGPLTYHTEGPLFEAMKTWHNAKLPGVAAVALKVAECYSGAEKIAL